MRINKTPTASQDGAAWIFVGSPSYAFDQYILIRFELYNSEKRSGLHKTPPREGGGSLFLVDGNILLNKIVFEKIDSREGSATRAHVEEYITATIPTMGAFTVN